MFVFCQDTSITDVLHNVFLVQHCGLHLHLRVYNCLYRVLKMCGMFLDYAKYDTVTYMFANLGIANDRVVYLA